MYDIDAIALQYGFYNLYHSQEESCVMFVEIGYLHATVFVVQYHGNDIRILYCQPIEGCSGRDFDKKLTDMVYERLSQNDKITISEDKFTPRDRMSILSQCEKVKPFLGVNGLPDHDIKVTIHSRDVTVNFTTAQFNAQAEPIMRCLKKACKNCLRVMYQQYQDELKEADKPDIVSPIPKPKLKPITTIVLEGSSARFQCVMNAMRQVVREFTNHELNPSEKVRIDIK